MPLTALQRMVIEVLPDFGDSELLCKYIVSELSPQS